MRFASPEWLNYLWLLVPMAALMLFFHVWRGRTISRFSRSPATRKVMLAEVSPVKRLAASVLLLAAFALGLLALSRPQWGTRMENITRHGVDVLIAMDTSTSMDTQDAPPSRLAKAKEELLALIEQLEEARIGVISFAGTAFLQCPLTIDRTAARMFLEILETGLIPDPGTDIGQAIALARDTFQRHQQKYKVLILITDGENLSGDPVAEARRAAAEGVVLYTIGIGTPSGQPIPIRDQRGAVTDYKKDENGQPVISRLDESTLAEIARTGNGRYFRATAGEGEVRELMQAIESMEKKELQSRMVRRYLERYQIPLLLAILCLAGEGLLLDRKRSWKSLRERWRKGGMGESGNR